jgi:hypothetical protein
VLRSLQSLRLQCDRPGSRLRRTARGFVSRNSDRIDQNNHKLHRDVTGSRLVCYRSNRNCACSDCAASAEARRR